MFARVRLQPLSLVLLLGGVGFGCSNWLGLEGLTFEAGSGGAPSLGTGGQSSDDGSGGAEDVDLDPYKPPLKVALDSFPSTWPTGTLFAVEQGNTEDPHYFAYDPAEHRLSVLQLVRGEDFIASSTWAADQTWTHLVALSSSAGPVLIGYDSFHGIVERVHGFQEDGSFEATRSAGNQHTHLLVWPLDEGHLLFGYDQNTGFYRGIPATSEQDVAVMQGTIDAGWITVDAMHHEGAPALLFHRPDTGEFALYQATADGLSLIGEGQTEAEHLAFAWAYGSTLALYNAGLGEVDWLTIEDGAGGAGGAAGHYSLEASAVDLGYLRRALTWVGTFELEIGAAVLSFDDEVLDLNFPFSPEDDHIVR